jgi:hypothetical protein
MAFAQDVLTRIVNVSWTGGVAVEFTDRPDYLTMNHALSMNKVTISFWFRVPKEAVDAARAKIQTLAADYGVFDAVIPLISWGGQLTTPVTDIQRIDTGAIDSSAGQIFIEQISGSHSAPLQPSGIGVYVGFVDQALLNVHIVTNVHASGAGLLKIATGWTGDFVGINQTPPHVGSPIYANVKYIMTDVTQVITEEPETFGNNVSGGAPDVLVDKWNHLLISWTLGSPGKMWCSINNENKTGGDLPAMNDNFSDGPNDQWSWTNYHYMDHEGGTISSSFGTDNVPSNPSQIPAPPSVKRGIDNSGGTALIAPIEKIELAELQIFSGVTLDTGVEANRRAFIDYKRDENGNPIRDEDGKRTLQPVNPKQAEKLLGNKPAVLLHGSTKWQDGKNTGSLGIDADGEEIPSGQFQPTGEIKKYSPDPSIVEA